MNWLDYAATLTWSDYLPLYGFFVGSVAWKTTVWAGVIWTATHKFKWLPKWAQHTWQPSFKDSRTWMALVIWAMLITFPLGSFTAYHLSLEKAFANGKPITEVKFCKSWMGQEWTPVNVFDFCNDGPWTQFQKKTEKYGEPVIDPTLLKQLNTDPPVRSPFADEDGSWTQFKAGAK
jgi:hypothetical protein